MRAGLEEPFLSRGAQMDLGWLNGARSIGLFALAFGAVCGAFLYFTLPFEPGVWIVLNSVLVIPCLIWRRRMLTWVVIGGVGAAFFAALETERRTGANLRSSGTFSTLGTLIALEPRDEKFRLLFEARTADGPIPLRLTYDSALDVGGIYQLHFWATPIDGPLYPGGFDGQFKFTFDGIRGFGALRSANLISASSTQRSFNAVRLAIDAHIRDILPGQNGAIASALLTGFRGNLNSETREVFRQSGLAHLLAISGLHLTLVASFMFFLCRGLFWVFPSWSLRVDQRLVCTLAAMATALIYFCLSGAAIPTQRALILLLAAGLALVFGRQALSWRLWSLALLLVILISPSSVFSISTHLSFLAVAILIRVGRLVQAWCENQKRVHLNVIPVFRANLITTLATTIGVNFLTLPLILNVFGSAPLFGVAANLVAVPLAAFAIVPLAFISLISMLVGLETMPLLLLGEVIEFLIRFAGGVADLPFNEVRQPKTPLTSLLLLPMFLGFVLLLRPVNAMGRVQVVGALIVGMTMLAPHVFPRPVALHHPDGWVLTTHTNLELANEGASKISAYDYEQLRALWELPASDSPPPDPTRHLLSLATKDTGPILIYDIWYIGEMKVQGRWLRPSRPWTK